jgi:nucleotide-binding universal stress UspA family protein
LLVHHGRPAPHPRIVAAVNATTEETDEQALNAKIVELTLIVAFHLEAGSTQLLHVWAPFAERTIRLHSGDDQFAVYVEGARQRAAAALGHLVQSFAGGLSGMHSILRRGEPEDVIPEFVVADGTDLIIMGTVARAGIAGMLSATRRSGCSGSCRVQS